MLKLPYQVRRDRQQLVSLTNKATEAGLLINEIRWRPVQVEHDKKITGEQCPLPDDPAPGILFYSLVLRCPDCDIVFFQQPEQAEPVVFRGRVGGQKPRFFLFLHYV